MPDAAWSLYERQIHAARQWAKDCDWRDLDGHDLDAIDPHVLIGGVERHYEGGWERFIEDAGLGRTKVGA